MGKAIDTITGYVSGVGTTPTGLTMATGDSKTIRNFQTGVASARLLEVISFTQGTGMIRIASPGMHDSVNGIRIQHTSANPTPQLPKGRYFQTFEANEILTMEATGSATSGDIEQHSAIIYYDDLPGISARLIDENTLQMALDVDRGFFAVPVSITAAQAGGYGGSAAINSTVDQFIANRDYALLGGICSVAQGVVRVTASEFGNLGVSFPGHNTKPDVTGQYFVELSRNSGLATIPVFNSSNKGGVFVSTTNNENAASPVVTLFLALLKPGFVPSN